MKKIITILLFGSIWGLVEATLGGALHAVHSPVTGSILAPIGFSILYAALRAGVRPAQLALVALIAAAFKFLDAPLLGLPLFERAIVNPAAAIATQGLACAVILRRTALTEGIPALALRYLGVAAAAVLAFNLVSMAFFGWQTPQSQDVIGTALVRLPLIAAAAVVLSRFVVERVRLTLGAGWQAAAAMLCVVLIAGSRLIIG